MLDSNLYTLLRQMLLIKSSSTLFQVCRITAFYEGLALAKPFLCQICLYILLHLINVSLQRRRTFNYMEILSQE